MNIIRSVLGSLGTTNIVARSVVGAVGTCLWRCGSVWGWSGAHGVARWCSVARPNWSEVVVTEIVEIVVVAYGCIDHMVWVVVATNIEAHRVMAT